MAVEKQATLILKLQDYASAILKKLEGPLEKFKGHVVAIGLATAGWGYAIGQAMRAWGEQEAATLKLDTALKGVRGTTEGASARLVELASKLQNLTTFTDDEIISAEALLASFKLTEHQIGILLPRALDLAIGRNLDLHTATMILGKAMAGNVDVLGRYFGKMDMTVWKSGDLNKITQELDRSFGGLAIQTGQTTLGAMQRFGNQIGELRETAGKFLSEFLRPAMELGIGFIQWLNLMVERHSTLARVMAGVAVALFIFGSAATALGAILTWGGAIVSAFNLGLWAMTVPLSVVTGLLGGWALAAVMAGTAIIILAKNFDRVKDIAVTAAKEIVKTWRLVALAFAALARGDFQEAAILMYKVFEGTMTKIKLAFTDAGKAIKNKLGEVGKAFSGTFKNIREEGTNTIEGWNDAVAGMKSPDMSKTPEVEIPSAPVAAPGVTPAPEPISGGGGTTGGGTGGGATGGRTGALPIPEIAPPTWPGGGGYPINNQSQRPPVNPWPNTEWIWGNVSKRWMMVPKWDYAYWVQRGAPLGSGGVVLPTSGGTLARLAERGQAEAVIPLGDSRAQAMLGGGKSEVHIHAGVIVADEMSVDRFARRIDEKLYELKRNRESRALE